MTYRVYVRWPRQKVSNKTNTESKEVADAAWNELKQLLWNGKQKPIGLVYSCNGKQLNYIDLTDSSGHHD
jgi:hypothetical protein